MERPIDEVVELDDPEDADETAAPAEGPTGPSRAEKKSNRFRELQDGKAAAEAETYRLKARLDALERRTSESRGSERREQDDAIDEAISLTREEEAEVARHIERLQSSGNVTVEEAQSVVARSRQLEDRRVQLMVQKAMQSQAANRNPTREYLERNHSDVLSNQQAKMLAYSEYTRRIAKGETESYALHDECCEYARQESGMSTRGARVEQRDRDRHVGTGPSGRTQLPKVKTLTMTAPLRRLALAWADSTQPKLEGKSDAEKVKAWANGPGRDLAR